MEETGLAQALVYTLDTIRHVAAILHLQQSGCSAWGFPTSGSVTESDRVCAMKTLLFRCVFSAPCERKHTCKVPYV